MCGADVESGAVEMAMGDDGNGDPLEQPTLEWKWYVRGVYGGGGDPLGDAQIEMGDGPVREKRVEMVCERGYRGEW